MAEAPVDAVGEAMDLILAYLRTHPNAADTAEGISQWWLDGVPLAAGRRHIQRALDRLVARRQLRAAELPGGGRVYRLNADSRRGE